MAEALAAAAWAAPGYSYSRNYISDLGRTVCAAPHACSPWAVVMNTGFVLGGILAITAALLLAPLVPKARLRRTLVTLAFVHGVGSILVGIAHGGAPKVTGYPSLHVVAAYAAIIGGNLGLIAASACLRPPAPRWMRAATLTCGLIGLGCGLALVGAPASRPGLMERGAVDPITAWEVAAGLVLLLHLRRARAPVRVVVA